MSKTVQKIVKQMSRVECWNTASCNTFKKFCSDGKKRKSSNIDFPYSYVADIAQYCDQELIAETIKEDWFKFDIKCVDNLITHEKLESLGNLLLNCDKTDNKRKLKINKWWVELNKKESDAELRCNLSVYLLDNLLPKFSEDCLNIIFDYIDLTHHNLIPAIYS